MQYFCDFLIQMDKMLANNKTRHINIIQGRAKLGTLGMCLGVYLIIGVSMQGDQDITVASHGEKLILLRIIQLLSKLEIVIAHGQ